MKYLITLVLGFQMVFLPVAQQVSANSTVPEPTVRESHAVIRLLRTEVEANPAFYYAEEDLTPQQELENKSSALEGIHELLRKLEDSSYTLASIREEMITKAITEEEAQLVDLKFVINRMPPETLDQIFQTALERGSYDASLKSDFDNAFTATEKRNVVVQMIQSDLFRVKSMTLKRLGMLDRDALASELRLMQSLLNTKARGTWRVVLVVVLGVAAAGFVSWMAISATKNAWERRTRELEAAQPGKENDLRQDYADREAELRGIFEERNRLREEGYVWAVCGTSSKVKTASCSYDFANYSGTEVCTTRCMKNMTTGDELLPQTSCSSAFIPSNCYQTNPYQSGYNSGYDSGYNEGWDTGYDRAYRDAYDEFYQRGYDTGYFKGYDEGYNLGFSDGWEEADYDDWLAQQRDSTDAVAQGLKAGYREGYAMALSLKIAQ